MARDFNAGTGFHHHQQGLLYQSVGEFGEPISGGNFYSSINLSGNEGSSGGIHMFPAPQVNSPAPPSTLLLDTVPGLKHDTGLAVEWSVEEQYKLEEGLAKYASEPQIMQYIKIAASLNDKTVRDVALRCQWMGRKRRKSEEPTFGKKMKEQKNKMVDMTSPSPASVPAYSSTTNHHHLSDYMLSGGLSCSPRHLLEENNQAFCQISANLSTLKLQDNIELFLHTKKNITTILNDMRSMPGIMSRMPPLPVLLNEELATSIFPNSSQWGC